jgi:hypothetical protein
MEVDDEGVIVEVVDVDSDDEEEGLSFEARM